MLAAPHLHWDACTIENAFFVVPTQGMPCKLHTDRTADAIAIGQLYRLAPNSKTASTIAPFDPTKESQYPGVHPYPEALRILVTKS